MTVRKFFGGLGGGLAAGLTAIVALPVRGLGAAIETGVEMANGKSFEEAATGAFNSFDRDMNNVCEGAFNVGQKVGEAIGPEATAIATVAVVAHSLGKRDGDEGVDLLADTVRGARDGARLVNSLRDVIS